MPQNLSIFSQHEDNTLFLLIKQRDREAFSIVYRKYHPYLYAVAFRYLKNVEMAEDTVQHIFVKLWETTKDISIEVNLKNYLYTMTKNHILNLFRDNRETISLNYINAQSDWEDDVNILSEIEQRQLSELLHKGIDNLPLQKQQICKIKIEENVTNQEIADRMGLSVHTVKSHYQESIKMLREYFQKIKSVLL